MKNIAKSLVVAGALALTGVASAMIDDLNPYLGLDYKHSWSHKRVQMTGSDQDVLAKTFPGGSVYLGSRFHENFGVELGYDFSKKKEQTFRMPALSGINAAGDVKSKLAFSGARFDLNAYLPLDNCFELVGSLGLGWVKPRLSFENVSLTQAGFNSLGFNQVSTKHKVVARLGAGAQYMVNDNIGLRGLVRWENTSKLRVSNDNVQWEDDEKKLFSDTTSVNLGVFYKF
ncbi:MAG: outer membrane beta-barrel protein [Gammaproteobacteria bacterium]